MWMWGKENNLYTVCGSASWYDHYGNQCGGSQKIENRSTM